MWNVLSAKQIYDYYIIVFFIAEKHIKDIFRVCTGNFTCWNWELLRLRRRQTQCDESDLLIMQHGEKTSTSVLSRVSGFLGVIYCCCTTHPIILSYLDYLTPARITLRNTENKTRHFKVQKNKMFQHIPRQLCQSVARKCLPLTATTVKPSVVVGGNKKSNMLVFLWGGHEVS